MKFFWCQGIFFVNFDFKNTCKNEFEDNNEKTCSRFKNESPLKIDFRADWTHESNPTAWELKFRVSIISKILTILQNKPKPLRRLGLFLHFQL